MKATMSFVLLSILALIVNNGCGNNKVPVHDVATETNKWYHLCPDHNLIDEFRLNAGESKKETIKSKKRLWVGFGTDAPQGLDPKDVSMRVVRMRYPILMYQQGTGVACSNRIGGGLLFSPVKGEIQLVVTNRSSEHFKVYVMTIPSVTYNW